MATEEIKSPAEADVHFAQLAEPFDPSEIKWRVTHTTKDGNRGAVIAYADPRAYTDRLNQLFTPAGWTRSYDVATLSAVTRMKRDKQIQTGKILVTCTLTIVGLGCHTGSGEEWADEDNAMTSAEAQAFKRAASCFGLGRYLITPEALMLLYKRHLPDLLQRGLPNHSLFEAYLQYCYSPKHTVGEQLLDVRRDKKERAAFAELQEEAEFDAEKDSADEERYVVSASFEE